jgi:uncharacterized GH25 family protein
VQFNVTDDQTMLPVDDVEVEINDSTHQVALGQTNSNGTFIFTPISFGWFTIFVNKSGYFEDTISFYVWKRNIVITHPTTIYVNETIEIWMDDGQTALPIENVLVEIYLGNDSDGTIVASNQTDSSGIITFTPAVAGTYALYASKYGYYDHGPVNFDVIANSCVLEGDYPPCNIVTLREVIDYIQLWILDEATLADVVTLINGWVNSS